MCLGCVLGLVVLPLSVSGSLFGAIVVRLGVVLLVLVLVVVGSVCGTGASSGYCSAVIASVGSVASGAQSAVCYANASSSGDEFGCPICIGVTRLAVL